MFKLQLKFKWEMYKENLKNWFKGNTYFKIGTKIR